MSDSVRPHRRQPTRLLCPQDSPGKNTGVGCHEEEVLRGDMEEWGRWEMGRIKGQGRRKPGEGDGKKEEGRRDGGLTGGKEGR